MSEAATWLETYQKFWARRYDALDRPQARLADDDDRSWLESLGEKLAKQAMVRLGSAALRVRPVLLIDTPNPVGE